MTFHSKSKKALKLQGLYCRKLVKSYSKKPTIYFLALQSSVVGIIGGTSVQQNL